jgi:hypothetical protein
MAEKVEIDRLTKLTKDLEAQLTLAQANAKPKLVYAPRKLTKYAGDTSGLDDWITEYKAAITAQGLEGKEAADFLFAHLEGDARKEVKHCKSIDRETVKGVVGVLQAAFGEISSETQVLHLFLQRHQHQEESLRTFSLALMELIDRAFKIKDNCLPDRDKSLRDAFAERVADEDLRKELKSLIRRDQTMTFHQVREEAYKIEADTCTGKRASKNKRSDQVALTELAADGPSQLEQDVQGLKKMIGEQQKLIQDLLRSKEQPFIQKDKSTVECYFCHQKGHVKKNCSKYLAKPPRSGNQPAGIPTSYPHEVYSGTSTNYVYDPYSGASSYPYGATGYPQMPPRYLAAPVYGTYGPNHGNENYNSSWIPQCPPIQNSTAPVQSNSGTVSNQKQQRPNFHPAR